MARLPVLLAALALVAVVALGCWSLWSPVASPGVVGPGAGPGGAAAGSPSAAAAVALAAGGAATGGPAAPQRIEREEDEAVPSSGPGAGQPLFVQHSDGAPAVGIRVRWLTETALRQNITLSAPTTLITVLRSVAHIWQVERQHQNAEEIADRAGKLYDKFEGFVGDMASVRQRLEQAATAHDKAMGKLSEGPGNLVRQVENLKQLGAKAKKSLPDDVVEASGARQDLLEGPSSEAAE